MARSKPLPAMPMMVGDWMKDPRVQGLDYYMRGIWFEILCLMWESEHRGKLLLKGKPISPELAAKLLGLPKQDASKAMKQLEAEGPADIDPETGALVCDWMLASEDRRRAKAEAGRLGGLRSRPPQADLFGSKGEAEEGSKRNIFIETATESLLVNGEGKGGEGKKKDAHLASEGQEVAAVFTYWRERREEVLGVGDGPVARMTDKRAGKIRARLKEGYTVEQLKQAVDGLLGSAWHVQRGFTDLELACRDEAHVNQCRTWAKGDGDAERRGEEFEHLG